MKQVLEFSAERDTARYPEWDPVFVAVDGGTRFVQHEADRGIWLWFWNSDWIEPASTRVLEAFTERAAGQ